jgi:hypothetical protein
MKSFILVCVITLLGILALGACGQASSTHTKDNRNPSDVPTAVSSLTPPDALPTGAPFLPTLAPYTPGPTLPPIPTSTPIILQPQSTPVSLGKPYPFRLYTHCGIDFNTDFDGSFWDASDKPYNPRSLDSSIQTGAMTLIDTNHARFDWDGGSLDFDRHIGPKILPGFCK